MYRIKSFRGIELPHLSDDYSFDVGENVISLDYSRPQTRITHRVSPRLVGPELQLGSEPMQCDITFDPETTAVRGIVVQSYRFIAPTLSNIEIEGRILTGTMIPEITGRMAIANLDMRANLGNDRRAGGTTPVGTLQLI